jgi:hypothetical protein
MPADLKILPAAQIDRVKWDECIANAGNGLIYSRFDYLAAICDNWHGLVVNGYDVVMALPWRKKFGIRYFYEPAFTQQLGLVGNLSTPTDKIFEACFSLAGYGDLLFNFDNSSIITGGGTKKRTNLVIDLSSGYEKIYAGYKKDLQQNLKKSERLNLCILSGEYKTANSFYRSAYKNRFEHVRETDYLHFENLCDILSKKEMCFTRKVVNAKSELLSIGIFFRDNKRLYNIMNTTTGIGRDAEANHYLLDSVIKEFAGQELLFDFEGSDIPGIKAFYEKFGATEQAYYHYHFNRLPFPLRLLKK